VLVTCNFVVLENLLLLAAGHGSHLLKRFLQFYTCRASFWEMIILEELQAESWKLKNVTLVAIRKAHKM
jgi:hypothetical protein